MTNPSQFPRLRLLITTLVTTLLSVITSVMATQIAPNGELEFSKVMTSSSSIYTAAVALLWLLVQVAYLRSDESLLAYAKDEVVLARMRQTVLSAYADLLKLDPRIALTMDVNAVLDQMRVKK